MKTLKFAIAFIFLGIAFFTGCKEEPMPIEINIVQNGGDADATFEGTGNSGTKTVTWNNSVKNMGWDMDIYNATAGSFRLQVWDAASVIVLDKTLAAGSGPNSLGGTTTTGTLAGAWKITVTATDFNGTGSFSLTPAN